jgi:antitoxin (DNA-binding transcriptional repressor) of toxin-antitoxin stability system
MIHKMTTATIRDLRTRFPEVRKLLDQEGEVVVTDRGRPIVVLRVYDGEKRRPPASFDYLGRLRRRMKKPLSKAARSALDEANRAER